MKKIIFLSFVCVSFYTFSQTAKNPAKKIPVAKTPQPFVVTSKDSMLCRAWKLASAEVFGVGKDPNEKQKNDGVTFHYDQTALLTIEGESHAGKWVTDRARTVITVTAEGSNEIVRLKIKKLEKQELIIQHQDKDLITTTYIYAPVK